MDEKLTKKEIQEKKEDFKEMAGHLQKGKFTDWCTHHGHKSANSTCIAHAIKEAKKTNNVTLKKQAILARTFAIMRGRKAAAKRTGK